MTLFLRYSDPGGIEQPAALVALGSNIRFGKLGLAMSAELGIPDMSNVEIDDPGGIWNFVGLRAFDVRETAAASNNTVIGRFVIQNRTVERNPERALLTRGDRMWTFDLADYNWHIGKRILVDADSKRPAETAGDRLRWLLARADHISLNDYGHVTYPTQNLDPHDYRGETAGTVLADCAVEAGYNFWADHNEAHGTPELFFFDPDSTAYASSLTITNGPGEADSVTSFFPYMDAVLQRSPERLAAGVFLPYTNGFVYVHNSTTAGAYANVDRAAPMSTVHTAARATRVANKFLSNNNTESDRITCGIKVPAAQVNDVRHGHRIQVRFTHLPGYDDGNYHWMRVLKRQVIQDEEGGGSYYRIVLEMVPSGGVSGGTGDETTQAATSGGILYGPADVDSGQTNEQWLWTSNGDVPSGGHGIDPIDGMHFAYIGTLGSQEGFRVLATAGTLDIAIQLSIVDVVIGGPRTYTLQLKKNGSVVASDVDVAPNGSYTHTFTINVSDLSVVAGDLLTTWMTFSALANPAPSASINSDKFEILPSSTVTP